MRSAAMLAAFSITVVSLTAAGAAAAQAQAEVDGELVYRQQCARCHDGGTGRMASSEELRERTADQIYGALNFGLMRRQGLDLSDAERRAVAMYLSGGAISDPPIEQIPQSA
jgi:mono/diheme cytochrome c family protein